METYVVQFGYVVLFFLSILYIAALLYLINDIILILIPAIKCRKVKDCMNDECPYRDACRHTKLTEWEKIPPWYRPAKEQQKKPSIQQQISHWFKDFFS